MRKGLLYPTLVLGVILSALSSYSQGTTLALGDIAFTGYNADNDQFSFVILRTGGIAANTAIRFTDNGWKNGACGTDQFLAGGGETEILWTAAVAIPYGRQIAISGLTATYQYGAPGTVTGTGLVLSEGAGDQILAFQGTRATHVMLAGIHMNFDPGFTTAADWDGYTPAEYATMPPEASNLPDCLVNGTHALFITSAGAEVDNARIKPSVILSGNPATDRSRINNVANWDVNDVTPFVLAPRLSGLPVEFTWIKAAGRNGNVQVDWGIGTEEEMKDYTIERSDDGRLYGAIGKLDAAGKKAYSFTDVQPGTGSNFYRIKATEINGIVKYSTIAVVNLSKGATGIGVYPNVVKNNNFTLQVTNLPAGNYKLNLFSAAGQLVFSRNVGHAGGSSTQAVTLPASVQKGVYRINMSNGSQNNMATIIVE